MLEFDGAALKFTEVLGSRAGEVAELCAWTVAASISEAEITASFQNPSQSPGN